MKKILLIAFLLLSTNSVAHKRWLLPSIFNISEAQWITFDATVSNNIFYPDEPWPLINVFAIAPDHSVLEIQNKHQGKRRSTFEIFAEQKGTYKISSGGDVFFAQYTKSKVEAGEKPIARTRGFNFAKLKQSLPKDAKDIKFAKSSTKLETYLTLGAPSEDVFKPINSGLELIPVTHPNDLYQGEVATFKFLVNGKAVENVGVQMVWEGTRYRNEESAKTFKTNSKGEVKINLDRTGRFLLEAAYNYKLENDKDFEELYLGYIGTFEVLPQ